MCAKSFLPVKKAITLKFEGMLCAFKLDAKQKNKKHVMNAFGTFMDFDITNLVTVIHNKKKQILLISSFASPVEDLRPPVVCRRWSVASRPSFTSQNKPHCRQPNLYPYCILHLSFFLCSAVQ